MLWLVSCRPFTSISHSPFRQCSAQNTLHQSNPMHRVTWFAVCAELCAAYTPPSIRSRVFLAPASLLRRAADFTVLPSLSSSTVFIAPSSLWSTRHPRMPAARCSSDLMLTHHTEPAIYNHIIPTSLSGGQRRALRAQGKSLKSIAVSDLLHAVTVVQSMLSGELTECELTDDTSACQLDAGDLVKCQFINVEKKPEAVVLAQELAALLGSSVADCVGNTCLLYRGRHVKHA